MMSLSVLLVTAAVAAALAPAVAAAAANANAASGARDLLGKPASSCSSELQAFLKRLSPSARFIAQAEVQAFADSHSTFTRNKLFPHAQPTAQFVVRPGTEADVVAAVKYASQQGLDFAVRSGGHSLGGDTLSQGGLLLDIRSMNKTTFDNASGLLTVEGGTVLHQITDYMAKFGRSPAIGICPGVGAGIYHGGWGALSRLHGLAIDNVVSANMVTADGKLRQVSATSNPDLFWGLRGAVSNLGVVTSVTLKTHDVAGSMQFGVFVYTPAQFKDVASWSAGLKDDRQLGTIIVVQGSMTVQFIWVWGGRSVENVTASCPVKPLSVYGRGSGYFNFQNFYYEFTKLFDEYAFSHTRGGAYTFQGNASDDTFLSSVSTAASAFGTGLFEMWGGAIGDVPSTATAFWPRSTVFAWSVLAYWHDATKTNATMSTIDAFYADAIRMPGVSTQVYMNYVQGTPANLVLGYGGNIPRLQQLKKKYDPKNFFHRSYNVK